MAFEDVKQNIAEADEHIRSYLESSKQYYELKGFKILTKAVMVFVKAFAVVAVVFLFLVFISVAAALWIGGKLNNPSQGFLLVALLYFVLGVLIYLFRHKLRKPILRKFSEFYFDEI